MNRTFEISPKKNNNGVLDLRFWISRKNIRSVQNLPIWKISSSFFENFILPVLTQFLSDFYKILICFRTRWDIGIARFFFRKTIAWGGVPPWPQDAFQIFLKAITISLFYRILLWKKTILEFLEIPQQNLRAEGGYPPKAIVFRKNKRAIAISHRVLKHIKIL